MRYLLDTQIIVWAGHESERISKKVREIMSDDAHELSVSFISLWEITIKASLGKLKVSPGFIQEIANAGYHILYPNTEHLQTLRHLPHHHGDPFDRMLIAQAASEGITLITSDKALKAYNAKIILA